MAHSTDPAMGAALWADADKLLALGADPGPTLADVTEPLVDWEVAAERISKQVEAPLEKALRAAADTFYADVLSDVQCYLRDNASFNLGVELEAARRATVAAHEQLERIALARGPPRGGWPTGRAGDEAADAVIARAVKLIQAEKGVAAAERMALASGLRERAEWLESERRKGGSSELRIRATEATAIADMIERGRFSAQAEAS